MLTGMETSDSSTWPAIDHYGSEFEEMVMDAQDLCSTCNRQPNCIRCPEPGVTLRECEEYVGLSPPHGSTPHEQPPPIPRMTPPGEFTFLGLCANCERRHDCGRARQPGGVWHCEEYQ
jgi:hypothetical protein